MKLCSICNENFNNKFEEGSCYICNNSSNEILNKVESIRRRGGGYFSLSLEISKDFLAREEDVFDIQLGRSIKLGLAQKIREKIEKNTKMKYSPLNADVKIRVKVPSGEIIEEAEDIFIYGAYSKLKPWISQKRWKKYEHSVEEIIGEKIREELKGEGYVMHSSGREDVDAINTAFRPFVFEIKKAKIRKINPEFEKIFNKDREDVKIKIYGKVPRSFITLVSDSHFDKGYRAYIIDEEKKKGLFEALNSIEKKENIVVNQKTPLRVIMRRKDKYRRRKIYKMSFGRDERGVYMDIYCEAGLYIKEFISGDRGRTKPSLSELTNRKLKCSFLIVKNINYSFLNYVFNHVRLQ